MTIHMFDIQQNNRDALGNQHFLMDLPGFRTDSQAICKALKLRSLFTLSYRAHRGASEKSGSIDPKDPSFDLIFERGVDPDGVWDIQIEAHGPDACTREVWHQQIFVQKDLSRSPAEVSELARRHAPIFVFSKDEHYFPVSLQTLLNAPEIRQCTDTVEVNTIFGDEDIPLSELGDFMRFNGHRDYLLDSDLFGMKDSVFTSLGRSLGGTTVYYSYIEDPSSDRFFITYHLLYAFDTKTGVAKWIGLGPHIFDRESMIMVFNSAEEPVSMVISGHLEGQLIFLFDKLKIWKEGRISVPYDDERTLKLDTHPVIAVAEGSHALYPTSGVYHVSALAEIAGFLDSDVVTNEGRSTPEIVPEQLVVPSSVHSETLAQYDLVPLGLDRLCSRIDQGVTDYDPYNAYLVFSGFWVDVPGWKNARFPPFTRKIAQIDSWIDEAYLWDWNDLPETLQQNNALIREFLEANVDLETKNR
jgi:hypothetical protein